ncbi:hypothetical protein LEMLEM_LOCUS27930 [Lemmus lemmus]
MQSEKGRGKG